MHAGSFLVLAALAVPAADGTAELQGRWRLLSVERGGRPVPIEGPQPRISIRGDKALHAGQVVFSIVADPAVSPRMIDLRFDAPARELEGIYTVEGATLRVCLNRRSDGVKERPEAFSTRGKDDYRLLTFRRVDAPEDDSEGVSGFLGVALRFDEERTSVVVAEVLDIGPAKGSGLREGDVLLSVGEAATPDLKSAIAAVRRAKPGEPVSFRVRRDGRDEAITVRAGVFPFTATADLE